MKIAIMQPYLFPYIGYFQLIYAVDIFVVFDDVNYINGGWINRNRILLNGVPHKFSIPLSKVTQNKKIKDLSVVKDHREFRKFRQTIFHAYKNAPYYKEIEPLLNEFITDEKIHSLVDICIKCFELIFSYLELPFNFQLSSKLEYDRSESGIYKISKICKKMGANTYINLPGKGQFYAENKAIFEADDIELLVLDDPKITYKQYDNEFVTNLSIIDVLMFNSKDRIKEFLEKYYLNG